MWLVVCLRGRKKLVVSSGDGPVSKKRTCNRKLVLFVVLLLLRAALVLYCCFVLCSFWIIVVLLLFLLASLFRGRQNMHLYLCVGSFCCLFQRKGERKEVEVYIFCCSLNMFLGMNVYLDDAQEQEQ